MRLLSWSHIDKIWKMTHGIHSELSVTEFKFIFLIFFNLAVSMFFVLSQKDSLTHAEASKQFTQSRFHCIIKFRLEQFFDYYRTWLEIFRILAENVKRRYNTLNFENVSKYFLPQWFVQNEIEQFFSAHTVYYEICVFFRCLKSSQFQTFDSRFIYHLHDSKIVARNIEPYFANATQIICELLIQSDLEELIKLIKSIIPHDTSRLSIGAWTLCEMPAKAREPAVGHQKFYKGPQHLILALNL